MGNEMIRILRTYEQLTFDSVWRGFCGKRELKAWCCPDCADWLESDVYYHHCRRSGCIVLQEGLRTLTPDDGGMWSRYLAKLGLDMNGRRL